MTEPKDTKSILDRLLDADAEVGGLGLDAVREVVIGLGRVGEVDAYDELIASLAHTEGVAVV